MMLQTDFFPFREKNLHLQSGLLLKTKRNGVQIGPSSGRNMHYLGGVQRVANNGGVVTAVASRYYHDALPCAPLTVHEHTSEQ